jgi:hypothetical protein
MAIGQSLFLLTVFAKTVFGHVHQLCSGLSILQLRNINVGWTNARLFKGYL